MLRFHVSIFKIKSSEILLSGEQISHQPEGYGRTALYLSVWRSVRGAPPAPRIACLNIYWVIFFFLIYWLLFKRRSFHKNSLLKILLFLLWVVRIDPRRSLGTHWVQGAQAPLLNSSWITNSFEVSEFLKLFSSWFIFFTRSHPKPMGYLVHSQISSSVLWAIVVVVVVSALQYL